MSFFARLMGRNGDSCAAAKGGPAPVTGKRQAPSSPPSGSFSLEFAGGRQPPPVAVKLSGSSVLQQQQQQQQQRASMDSDSDDCSIRMPGSLASCADRNRSNSLARRRAAIDISPRAVQRLADKVAVLDAGRLTSGSEGAGGVTQMQLEALYTDMQLIHRGRASMVYRARELRTGRRVILKAYDAASLSNSTRRAALDRQVLTLRTAQAAVSATAAAAAGGAGGGGSAAAAAGGGGGRAGGSDGLVLLERVVENPEATFLVLQACNGGTLIEAIANAGGKLPERQVAIKVALPLLNALGQLHAAGIVHRDIKPEHLMIHNGCLKVGDFGSAGCGTAAAAAAASAILCQLEQQQQQRSRSRASVDSLAGDQEQQLQQQAVLARLQALHQQVQADCVAAEALAAAAAAAAAGQRRQSHGAAAHQATPLPAQEEEADRRRSDHSDQRFGMPLPDTLAAQPSGPLSPVALRDAMNFRIGSIEYMAPEMLDKPTPAEVFHLVIAQGIDEDDLPTYDDKVDVWSAGVVLYEALSGLQPFLADSAADMAAVISTKLAQRVTEAEAQQHEAHAHHHPGRRTAAPHQQQQQQEPLPGFIARLRVSADAKQFLAACLQWDPARRPSAAQLLRHPWLLRMQEEAAAAALSRANSRRVSMRLSRSHDGMGGQGAAAAAAAAAAVAAGTAVAAAQQLQAEGSSALSLVDPLLSSMLGGERHNSLDLGVPCGLERSHTSEQLELGARGVLRTATQRLETRKHAAPHVHTT